MIHAQRARKRRMPAAWSPRLVVLVAFALGSCGGTSTKDHSPHRRPGAVHPPPAPSATHPPPSWFPPAGAVPMVPTPRAGLARCRQSRLLRPICPRQVPLSLDPGSYDLADGCANAVHITIASSRCTLPVWSYEVFAPQLGRTAGTQVRAWDGREWFSPSYAAMDPPPYHVHVEIQAAAGLGTPSTASPSFAGAKAALRVTDVLLNPNRARAASFGWVRWYGEYGQLVLAPTNPNGGGEEAGHLIFSFTAGGVNYDISLHAWASKERISGHGMNRVVSALEAGTALPHVVATLKAIVGSALRG
jgi:hypothetical protein